MHGALFTRSKLNDLYSVHECYFVRTHTYMCCLYIININLYKIQEFQELDFSKALILNCFQF